MKELIWLILIIAAVYGGYYLVKWGFPRLIRYALKRMVRRQFGIDFEEPKRPRRGAGPFSSPGPSPRPRRQGKKIPGDVGEYVEFEEISTTYEYTGEAEASHFRAEEQVVDIKWKDVNDEP